KRKRVRNAETAIFKKPWIRNVDGNAQLSKRLQLLLPLHWQLDHKNHTILK
ncbi:hypothetical protein KI387_034976, partial [Taxus chinensis]